MRERSEARLCAPILPAVRQRHSTTPRPLILPLVTSYGQELIKAGTFSVNVNGTVVCTDANTAVWNVMGGNCTGAGISSSFVNYVTGDYQIVFSSPPASNAVITASWTEIISPDGPNLVNVFNNLDYVGDGTSTGGFLSSVYARTPGGVSGHIFASCSSDAYSIYPNGYPLGALGLTQAVSWFYGTKIPGIFPDMSASTPFISAVHWRGDGPTYFQSADQQTCSQDGFCQAGPRHGDEIDLLRDDCEQASSTDIDDSAAATGPMWEGEVIGCATFSLTCPVTAGTYITSLASGSWGASGSTYNLAGSPANVGISTPMGERALLSRARSRSMPDP